MKIHDHEVTDADKLIDIRVLDEPGPGGAHHCYVIGVPGEQPTTIRFQEGGVKEAGINGITQETLIAIAIHRLRCFQSGPFACRENAVALTHLETALMWLQKRTRDRMARGVEGAQQA